MALSFSNIRQLAITAMFSDDLLYEHLVLKGGNALALVHEIGRRSSLDLDFSLEKDLDATEIKQRAMVALRQRFATVGYRVFDERFMQRPPDMQAGERWGGYDLEFKLFEQRDETANANLEEMRRRSLRIGPREARRFKIQISRYEYCAGKVEVDVDHYSIYVYSPEMIAVEKIRAICQQMPEYERGRRHPAARARDFYDVASILEERRVRLSSEENLDLFRAIFSAKEVPLELIKLIPETREFHRVDWPSVEQSVPGPLQDFDFYFDNLVSATSDLHSLWVE